MEKSSELLREFERVERALAQNLENEVRAWRHGRSLRHSMTASGVPVLRRSTRKPRPLRAETWR